MQTEHHDLPVVIMTHADDEALAIQAVQQGAQDYLVKGQTNTGLLRRALLYAVERRRTEQTILEQSRLIDMSLDAIYSSVLTPDRHFVIRVWNRGAERLYGWRQAEVVGHSAPDVLQSEFPIPRQQVVDTIIEKGNWYGEVLQRKRDGTPVTVMASYSAVRDEHGQTTGMVVVHHDITELKRAQAAVEESQKRMRHLIDSSLIGVCVADITGAVVDANQTYLDILGYTREDIESGQINWVASTPSELIEASENAIAEILVEGHCTPLELEYIRKDGSRIPILFGATLWDTASLNPSWVAFVLDITERKKADRIKDEFIGMVSHELKTPLTITIGALYTYLSPGIGDEEKQQLMEDAIYGAESLNAILDNLLELSRYQAKRLALQKEATNITEVVTQTVAKLRSKSPIHRLVVDAPGGLPPVMVDPFRIERVLHNLVGNAIKYSPDGGEIRVFVRDDDRRLIVGVKDNGIGISAEDQQKLFKRFQRLDQAVTGGISGIGLGLHVCHVLVEAHGGHIWVESEPGRGSTFQFTLPISPDDEE